MPILERHQPQRADDHKMIVDELRRLERQDVRMLQLRDHPHLAAEILHRRAGEQMGVRNLQRDADALDRIAGLVDGREAAFAELLLDDVLAQLLLRPQRLARPPLDRRTGGAVPPGRLR